MSNLIMSDVNVYYSNQTNATLTIPNLSIELGEKVAIMGMSGSGKTTLINIMSGLQKPTTGSVTWDNILINQLSQSKNDRWRFNHVGLIMQNFYLYVGLSALQNVLLPTGFRHFFISQKIKMRAKQLLNQVGIRSFDRKIDFMSRGEMQRVAIVRALLNQPAIIIADEPTASLDSENSQQIMQVLFELVDDIKATLILVTHDTTFLTHFDRQLTLKDGAIINDTKGVWRDHIATVVS